MYICVYVYMCVYFSSQIVHVLTLRLSCTFVHNFMCVYLSSQILDRRSAYIGRAV